MITYFYNRISVDIYGNAEEILAYTSIWSGGKFAYSLYEYAFSYFVR